MGSAGCIMWGSQCKMKTGSLVKNDEEFQVSYSRALNQGWDLLGMGPVLHLLESLEGPGSGRKLQAPRGQWLMIMDCLPIAGAFASHTKILTTAASRDVPL